MTPKIAFFDIDGTLTSEIDGSVPESAALAIRQAREAGNKMFLNTGRCFQNVEPRFRNVGFDGYVCGCGTHIVFHRENAPADTDIMDDSLYEHALYTEQPPEVIATIRDAARRVHADILFESRFRVIFDTMRPLRHPDAISQNNRFIERNYTTDADIEAPDFTCDKFVIWYEFPEQLAEFRKVSDRWFDCIDRGGTFREFVPKGYSKATGLQFVLDHYGACLDQAYVFGDSNNDLPMLSYVKHSVAMGNSQPEQLKQSVEYVTTNSSDNGIANALRALGFIH